MEKGTQAPSNNTSNTISQINMSRTLGPCPRKHSWYSEIQNNQSNEIFQNYAVLDSALYFVGVVSGFQSALFPDVIFQSSPLAPKTYGIPIGGADTLHEGLEVGLQCHRHMMPLG